MNLGVLDLLRDAYPHQQRCSLEGAEGETAVLSRLPVTGEGWCINGGVIAAFEVLTAGGPVNVVSMHLGWPWPITPQVKMARFYAAEVADYEAPVVIGGDFNTVAWSFVVHHIAEAVEGRALGPHRATLRIDPMTFLAGEARPRGVREGDESRLGIPLPIDQVIAPGGRVSRRPRVGSDHNGLVADITIF